MYFDIKRNRVLLRDGRSVLSVEEFSRRLLRGDDTRGLHVISCEDSRAYDLFYHASIGSDVEDVDVHPSNHTASDEDIDRVISKIMESPRYMHSMDARIEEEIEFFIRTNNILFVDQCINLVKKMKEKNVVWGVGRGSACASLIMYLLEINDINPLEYDIPFSELSKEQSID